MHQKRNSAYIIFASLIVILFIATLRADILPFGGGRKESPSKYNGGVETRFAQASDVVIGDVTITEKKYSDGGQWLNIYGQIRVIDSLYGTSTNKVIEFRSKVRDGKNNYYGEIDELAVIGLGLRDASDSIIPSEIVFLRNISNAWECLASYGDSRKGSLSNAVKEVINVENMTNRISKTQSLFRLIESYGGNELISQYALRSLVIGAEEWMTNSEYLALFSRNLASNENNYEYIVGDLCWNLRKESEERKNLAANLLPTVLKAASTESQLNYAVKKMSEQVIVGNEIRLRHESAGDVRSAVLETRKRIGQADSKNITKEDEVLFKQILPDDQGTSVDK